MPFFRPKVEHDGPVLGFIEAAPSRALDIDRGAFLFDIVSRPQEAILAGRKKSTALP
jgi:hypothetical protein